MISPTADFSVDTSINCSSFTPIFQNLTTNADLGATWLWNFGDQTATSDSLNPSHLYSSLGTFSVSLTATNSSGCQNNKTKSSYIKIIDPTVSITGIPAAGCIPFTFKPTPSVTNAFNGVKNYLWDFGDNKPPDNSMNPTHVYSDSGTFTVKLYITTNDNCVDSFIAPNAVSTGPLPTVNFIASPLVQCVAENIQFTDLSSAGDTWSWAFGDAAISTQQNPVHAYKTNNSYNVTLKVINNGCPNTLTKSSYIKSCPH
ncbi:MAG: PKD domain-containing protein [Ferruginibacter sp.]